MSSIFISPRARAFNLTVGNDAQGKPLEINQQIDYDAAHVVIDNGGTNQYLYLPDAGDTGRYAIPGQQSAVYALKAAGGVARAIWQAPPGNTQPPAIAGQQAILQFLESGIDISPSAGVMVQVDVKSPQRSLGNFLVAAGPAVNNAIYAVPKGTHCVGLLVTAAGLSELTVQGVTTGINYMDIFGGLLSLSGYFVSPVLSDLDTSVKVIGHTQAGEGPTTIYSVAILNAEGVFVFDNSAEPASVALVDTLGTPIGVGQTPLSIAEMPTATATPPIVAGQVGIGNTVLVPAVAGQTVYCFGGMVVVNVGVAGAFVQLTDSAHNVVMQLDASLVGNHPFDLHGAPVGPSGLGANIAVSGAAAHASISLAYAQFPP